MGLQSSALFFGCYFSRALLTFDFVSEEICCDSFVKYCPSGAVKVWPDDVSIAGSRSEDRQA